MINIWGIYLIDVLSKLGELFRLVMFFGSIVIVVTLICLPFIFEELENVDDKKPFYKVVKTFIAVFVLCLLGSTFIPSKETMYTMYVASYVTEENVQAGTEVVQDTVDYIVDTIVKITNGGNVDEN